MSLKISNMATIRQIETLIGLGYTGRGKYAVSRLSKSEAMELITELYEEERLNRKVEEDKYGNLADLLDPFNQINK